MSDEPDKKVPARLVYMGERIDTKNKLQCAWYILSGNGHPELANDGTPVPNDNERMCLYDKVRPFGCKVGAIYTFDMGDGTRSIYAGSARDAESWEADEDIVRWEVAEKQARLTAKDASISKRIGKDTRFATAMLPLKRIYHGLSFAEQNMFLAMVISELRRPIPAKDKISRDW